MYTAICYTEEKLVQLLNYVFQLTYMCDLYIIYYFSVHYNFLGVSHSQLSGFISQGMAKAKTL